MLQTLTVRELNTVVHSDTLEDTPEIRTALKMIQHSYHRGGILTRDFEDQFSARQAFRHDNYGFTLSLLSAYDTVHFPVAEGGAIRDDLRSMLNAGTISGLLLIPIVIVIFLPRMLTDTMLREIRGTRIQ